MSNKSLFVLFSKMYYSRNRRNYSIVESTSYSAVVTEFQTDRRLRNRQNAIQSSDQ